MTSRLLTAYMAACAAFRDNHNAQVYAISSPHLPTLDTARAWVANDTARSRRVGYVMAFVPDNFWAVDWSGLWSFEAGGLTPVTRLTFHAPDGRPELAQLAAGGFRTQGFTVDTSTLGQFTVHLDSLPTEEKDTDR